MAIKTPPLPSPPAPIVLHCVFYIATVVKVTRVVLCSQMKLPSYHELVEVVDGYTLDKPWVSIPLNQHFLSTLAFIVIFIILAIFLFLVLVQKMYTDVLIIGAVW